MNKVVALIAVGLVVVVLVMTNNANPASTNQTADSEKQTASISASALVLDVRTAAEFAESHAVRATNLSLQDIQAGILPGAAKDSEVVVYCRSGNRSAEAVTLLKQAGYSNVRDLGGVEAAKTAGLEFTI